MTGRSALVCACLVFSGVLAPSALAQLPTVTVPEVPTVPVPPPPPVPDLPVETPPAPPVQPPSLPSLPPVPYVPTGGGSTGGVVPSGVSGSGGSGGSGGSRGSEGRSSSPPRGATASERDPDVHAWPKKFKNRKRPGDPYGTTLSVWLERGGLITFVVRQEAPVCRIVQTFTVRGEAGVNRVRYLGRLAGKPLPPGTYTIEATAVQGTSTVSLGSVRIVIVAANRDVDDARAQRSNCSAGVGAGAGAGAGSSAAAGSASSGAAAAAPAAGHGDDGDSSEAQPADEGVAGTSASGGAADVLGSHGAPDEGGIPFASALPNPFEEAPTWLQPFLVAAVLAAIVLLQLAALPARVLRPAGAATFVARRRSTLALAGGGLLALVVLAILVV